LIEVRWFLEEFDPVQHLSMVVIHIRRTDKIVELRFNKFEYRKVWDDYNSTFEQFGGMVQQLEAATGFIFKSVFFLPTILLI
jgi:hypothetical protein